MWPGVSECVKDEPPTAEKQIHRRNGRKAEGVISILAGKTTESEGCQAMEQSIRALSGKANGCPR